MTTCACRARRGVSWAVGLRFGAVLWGCAFGAAHLGLRLGAAPRGCALGLSTDLTAKADEPGQRVEHQVGPLLVVEPPDEREQRPLALRRQLERTLQLQLAAQLAGQVGRRVTGGKVLVGRRIPLCDVHAVHDACAGARMCVRAQGGSG
eukprot:148473-Chlamydomonas_euryale.AAC.1